MLFPGDFPSHPSAEQSIQTCREFLVSGLGDAPENGSSAPYFLRRSQRRCPKALREVPWWQLSGVGEAMPGNLWDRMKGRTQTSFTWVGKGEGTPTRSLGNDDCEGVVVSACAPRVWGKGKLL